MHQFIIVYIVHITGERGGRSFEGSGCMGLNKRERGGGAGRAYIYVLLVLHYYYSYNGWCVGGIFSTLGVGDFWLDLTSYSYSCTSMYLFCKL